LAIFFSDFICGTTPVSIAVVAILRNLIMSLFLGSIRSISKHAIIQSLELPKYSSARASSTHASKYDLLTRKP
jgi:hypothetical protein